MFKNRIVFVGTKYGAGALSIVLDTLNDGNLGIWPSDSKGVVSDHGRGYTREQAEEIMNYIYDYLMEGSEE